MSADRFPIENAEQLIHLFHEYSETLDGSRSHARRNDARGYWQDEVVGFLEWLENAEG